MVAPPADRSELARGTIDRGTIDWATSRIRLRRECLFIPQIYRGETFYHLEFPSTGSYYRIGYAEYVFISLLDGETTFAEALTVSAQTLGAAALSEAQAKRIYAWLLEETLASFVDQGQQRGGQTHGSCPAQPPWYANPLWIKIPLGRPDAALTVLTDKLQGLLGGPLLFGTFMLFSVAIFTLASRWEHFLATSRIVFAPGNWAWMIAAWVLLKVIHELAHGIACKFFGGEVRDVGVILVLFTPMAYVDVTSAWSFTSKWQRLCVAIAGMYAEVVIAAIATIAWSRAESTWVAYLLYNVIVMASLSTLVFNMNPLMRFDGYYLLADLLEIPNLAGEGQQLVQRWGAWLFFGTSQAAPKRLGPTAWIIGFYGWASFGWRMVTALSIYLVASVMFEGAGLVLVGVGLATSCAGTLRKMVPDLVQRWHERPHTLWRGLGVGCGAALLLVLAYWYIPAPLPVTAPGVVDYQNLAVVRSGVGGFVQQVHVHDGDIVARGDLLITLTNNDVENTYRDLLHEIEASRIRQRMAIDRREATAEQIEARNQLALNEQLTVAWRKYDALSLRASATGRVVARSLRDRLDTYLSEGEEVLAIGNELHKEMVLSVADSSIDHTLSMVGKQVMLRIGARRPISGELVRVQPRGSTELPHPALAATAGGPLAVMEKKADADSLSEQHTVSERRTELVETRYKAVVRLPDDASIVVRSGERGFASLQRSGRSLGQDMHRRLTLWVREILSQAQEQRG